VRYKPMFKILASSVEAFNRLRSLAVITHLDRSTATCEKKACIDLLKSNSFICMMHALPSVAGIFFLVSKFKLKSRMGLCRCVRVRNITH
jgi:hypothetical protein